MTMGLICYLAGLALLLIERSRAFNALGTAPRRVGTAPRNSVPAANEQQQRSKDAAILRSRASEER